MNALNEWHSPPASVGRVLEVLARGFAAVAVVSIPVVGIQVVILQLGGGEMEIFLMWALIGFIAVVAKAFRLTFPERRQ